MTPVAADWHDGQISTGRGGFGFDLGQPRNEIFFEMGLDSTQISKRS
jgi:hypothetical protein